SRVRACGLCDLHGTSRAEGGPRATSSRGAFDPARTRGALKLVAAIRYNRSREVSAATINHEANRS
ncbi:MAG: hypothetical protein KGM43_12130, partial [Planctomycetota bacterium]|nr:hypothetical protein [Planctomycetota bacterium]